MKKTKCNDCKRTYFKNRKKVKLLLKKWWIKYCLYLKMGKLTSDNQLLIKNKFERLQKKLDINKI